MKHIGQKTSHDFVVSGIIKHSILGHDLKCGVKTIANQIGIQNSLNLYSLLLIMPYVQVTYFFNS